MTQFDFRGVFPALALAVMLTLAFAGDSVAAVKDGQQFGDWVGSCPQDRPNNCTIVQRQNVQGGARLFQLSIGKIGAKGEMGATALLPLGLHIPAGVSMVLDGTQAPMTLMRCVEAGCLAVMQFDPKFIPQLAKAKEVQLAMMDDFSRQTIIFKVSVSGLADGLKAVQ